MQSLEHGKWEETLSSFQIESVLHILVFTSSRIQIPWRDFSLLSSKGRKRARNKINWSMTTSLPPAIIHHLFATLWAGRGNQEKRDAILQRQYLITCSFIIVTLYFHILLNHSNCSLLWHFYVIFTIHSFKVWGDLGRIYFVFEAGKQPFYRLRNIFLITR